MFGKTVLFLFGICSLLPFDLRAQSGGEISVTFRCLSLDKPIREPLFVQPEGGEPLRVYTSSRTAPVTYTGPNPLVFYREIRDESGQTVRVPAGRHRFTGEYDSPLLLFSRPESEYPLRTTAIEDSLEHTPPGGYRIYNFTRKDIAGMIGQSRFRTGAGGQAFIRLEEEGRITVTARLAEFAEDGPQGLYSASWDFSPQFRYLVFIFPANDRTRGNIKIRIVSDLAR